MPVRNLIVSDDQTRAIRVGRTPNKSHVCIGVQQWSNGKETHELVIKLSESDVRELCADLLINADFISKGGSNGTR